MKVYSLLILATLVSGPAFAGYVSEALVPEQAREYVKELRYMEGRIATAQMMYDHAKKQRQLILNNYVEGANRDRALAKADVEINSQKFGLDKLQAEKDEVFGKWAPSRRDKLMEKVGELDNLEKERRQAWDDHKRFGKSAELKEAQANVDEAVEKFLETRKDLKVGTKFRVRSRVKAGLVGAATTAAAIGYEAATSEGAQASELKAADVQAKPDAERSEVSISELGDK